MRLFPFSFGTLGVLGPRSDAPAVKAARIALPFLAGYLFWRLPMIAYVLLLASTVPMVIALDCVVTFAHLRATFDSARVGDIVMVRSSRGLSAMLALGSARARGIRGIRGIRGGRRFELGRYAEWRFGEERLGGGGLLGLHGLHGLRVREAESAGTLAAGMVAAHVLFSMRSSLRRTTWADVCEILRRADMVLGTSGSSECRAARERFDAAARVVQRAWRARRALRALERRRAAGVIEDAALHAMYRPGGWRHGAVRDHWAGLVV